MDFFADVPDLARRLTTVGGVVGVVLGGSRARGTHRPDSDVDLGLYYRGALDVSALQALADEVSDEPSDVTEPGGWGPWVDGGGWLTVRGQRVDWIYRDLDRVRLVWADCQAGRYQVSFQVGHPLGFYSHAYAGELALSRVLADPSGVLEELRVSTRSYPVALGEALVRGFWEADFALRLAGYGVTGGDPTYTAGCLFRLVGVACQALHGRAARWLINEKGMVASAASLPLAPAGFAEQAHALLASADRPGEGAGRRGPRSRRLHSRLSAQGVRTPAGRYDAPDDSTLPLRPEGRAAPLPRGRS